MEKSNFILPLRKETHERYEANRLINQTISDAFHASLDVFVEQPNYPIPEVDYEQSRIVLVNDVLESGITAGDVPYGVSTLGESGCAVFCIHNALTYTRSSDYPNLSLETVAEEVASKGYYEPGKGTYHNLFDHLGARRATNVQDIFDALCTRKKAMVTLLVRNEEYNGRSGRHFINLVYWDGNNFLLNDSSIGFGLKIDAETIFKCVDIAWIW